MHRHIVCVSLLLLGLTLLAGCGQKGPLVLPPKPDVTPPPAPVKITTQPAPATTAAAPASSPSSGD